MRATVFTDQALTKHAGRFAWLSIDVEDPKNAAFLQKFPWEAVPTFRVIDPGTEKPVYEWLGTADVAQLERRFEEALAAVRGPAGTALARAERLATEGRRAEAVAAYAQVLAETPLDAPERVRVAEALVLQLSMTDDAQRCATVAADEAPRLPRGPAFSNVVATGLACAAGSSKDAAWRPGLLAKLEPLGREALDAPGVLADDRGAVYDGLVAARSALGDEAGARELALRWQAFLDDEARRAPTPEARASLDSWRVRAAIAAGDPARAIPALEASERDLPGDDNPPARLAYVYRTLGRHDEALAAIERALPRAYGTRKLGVYDSKATILEAKGDKEGVRRTVDEALAYAKTLPEGERVARMVQRLEKRRPS